MKANVGRLGDALERLMPFIIAVAIVTFAFFWFIQTPLNAYLRSRTDVAGLQTRLRTVQDATARAAATPRVDLQASMREFEKQMSRDDKVADVTAILAAAVLDQAPADKLRVFSIESSDRVKAPGDPTRVAPRVSVGTMSTSPDPRMSLFPVAVSYTPVKVTFSSTFEAIAGFMWKVRDLPTTVEVKSATLTRGLPLMKMELLIWVYQRGDAAAQEPGVSPPAPGSGPVNPTGPRVGA